MGPNQGGVGKYHVVLHVTCHISETVQDRRFVTMDQIYETTTAVLWSRDR